MKTHIRKNIFRALFLLIITATAIMAYGTGPAMVHPEPTPRMVQRDTGYGNISIFFIPNQGQLDERVAYAIQGKDKSVYFSPEGLTFVFAERVKGSPAGTKRFLREIGLAETDQQTQGRRWVVKLDFVGARRDVRPESLAQAETVISYFKGRPEEWKTGLRTSSKIIYRDLWPGIDLVYYGTVNRLKYDFIVHPGSDPAQIKLSYRGADRVEVTREGRLAVTTPLGVFQDEIPKAWQEMGEKREDVSVGYALEAPHTRTAGLSVNVNNGTAQPRGYPQHQGHVYGFTVGNYDRSRTLILDPEMLIYCGYIGGSGNDVGNGIAIDRARNAYVTGHTDSTRVTFPETVGPDLDNNGGYDAFVAKVNAAGTALVYCGYIGGSGMDYGNGIAVDDSGNAYVTGHTNSHEVTFPVKGILLDRTYNGGDWDAFVAKINDTGTDLVYCGYIGGSGNDYGQGIAVDGSGNAYVTGYTDSTQATFPIKKGPDLTYNGGDYDAFVAKIGHVVFLNIHTYGLIYCGYIGSIDWDQGFGIAVDGSGSAYVTGASYLLDARRTDAFAAKVRADGTSLDYFCPIGGSGHDVGRGIVVDAGGNAYVTGYTDSKPTDADPFPVTVGPDLTYNGGTTDAFVAKVNEHGSKLLYCGYIGGVDFDTGMGIAIDGEGNAYVTGRTKSSSGFPVRVGPDRTHNGGADAYVAKVRADGTGLVYCGYIGGVGEDVGNGIAVDGEGNAYVTGETGSKQTDAILFPVTVGPDLTYNGGTADAFVAKIANTQDQKNVVLPWLPLLIGD